MSQNLDAPTVPAVMNIGPPTVSAPVGGQVTISGNCSGCGEVRLYPLETASPGPDATTTFYRQDTTGQLQYFFFDIPVVSGTSYGFLVLGINATATQWVVAVTNFKAP